jgi:hypothetical protein
MLPPSRGQRGADSDVRALRLRNQRVSQSSLRTAQEVVAWLGAVQAQDFTGAKWGLGLRGKRLAESAVDREYDDGRILRTHILRPTWHFVAPADLRWLLSVSGSRVHAVNAHYYRKTGAQPLIARGRKIIERALEGGMALTRNELAARLTRGGIAAPGMQLAYLVMHAELDGVICSGPRRGKQFTYMLLDERVPAAGPVDRDEAVAMLARRYFTSRGPATVQDFVWWSGMTARDTSAALEAIKPSIVRETIGSGTYYLAPSAKPAAREADTVDLLPIYDEYLMSYKDRGALVEPLRPGEARKHDDYGHFLMVDGKLAGTWRRNKHKAGIEVAVSPYRPLTRAQTESLEATARQLQSFLARPVTLRVLKPGP